MEKKSKKSIVIGTTSLFLVMLVLLGLTYAYYRTRVVGNLKNEPSVNVEANNIEVTYQDGTSSVTFGTLVEPDNETVYTKKFEAVNTGDQATNFSIVLEDMTNDFIRNHDWVYTITEEIVEVSKADLNKTDRTETIITAERDVTDNENNYLAVGHHQIIKPSVTINVSSTEGKVVVHKYVLSLKYVNSDEDQSVDMGMNLSFKVNIKEESYTWDSAPEGTLLYAIKDHNTISATKTIPGREASASDEKVLATTEDDYGTSYYFRGAVDNNYVNYSGLCWRIVRVQGDGTIKLVLADENGECNADTYNVNNNTSAFINDAAAISYDEAINNNSLADWRDNNLNIYALSNTDWCKDLAVSLEESVSLYYGGNFAYTSTSKTYKPFERLYNPETANPTLKCNTKGLNNTRAERIDNNIGFLTADEMVYAGIASNSETHNDYLFTNANGVNSWTLSPLKEVDYNYFVFAFNGSGSFYYQSYDDENPYIVGEHYGNPERVRVRPAIVLKSTVWLSEDTTFIQVGTSENPYVIAEE